MSGNVWKRVVRDRRMCVDAALTIFGNVSIYKPTNMWEIKPGNSRKCGLALKTLIRGNIQQQNKVTGEIRN